MTAKPPPVTPDAEQLRQRLRVLAQEAPALIAAGVTSLRLGELEATLAPPAVAGKAPEPRAARAAHIDPLRDPSTYPGGRVPGFTRDEERDAKELEERPGGRRG